MYICGLGLYSNQSCTSTALRNGIKGRNQKTQIMMHHTAAMVAVHKPCIQLH